MHSQINGCGIYRQCNSTQPKKIMPFVKTWIDLENIILNKVTQKEKDKYHISLICGIQNMVKMNVSIKQKQTHRNSEQTWGCIGVGAVGEGWTENIGFSSVQPLSCVRLFATP